METEMYDSITKILKEKIQVGFDERVYGFDVAARRIMDEIILPIRLDLIEAQAKNTVYEAALENSNFKAIVVRNPKTEIKNGGKK